jgi:tetratricopeptide (TPR) repeat protein
VRTVDESLPPARIRLVSLLLITVVTLAVFGRVAGFDFINFDDNVYVYDNPLVRGGISPGGLRESFTNVSTGTWHPLTWLSHQLDVALWGMRPGGHHLTSLLLHLGTALLLYLFLEGTTGRAFPSLVAALLFAVHPMHVESVAWVSERKDVLSALFFVASLLAWARHVRTPSAGRYLAALLLFAAGLMAKPMVVTLPLVLLLLDRWPLERREGWGVLLREKVPFLLLSLGAGIVTLVTQRQAQMVRSLRGIPPSERVANALWGYLLYLGKAVWPSNLSFFYPLPEEPPSAGRIALAVLILTAATILVLLAARRRRAYLATGWGWFLVTLLPVIGLVQVGDQAIANRYTYLPYVGLFLLAAWGLEEAAVRRPLLRIAVLAAVAVLAVVSFREVGHWRGTVPLMERALVVDPGNYVAHNNLGSALFESGDVEGALAHYRAALAKKPFHPNAHYNMGLALMRLGSYQEASERFTFALHANPYEVDSLLNLGVCLLFLGKPEEAAGRFRQVLALRPDSTEARENLAVAEKRVERLRNPSAPVESGAHGRTIDRADIQYQTGLTLRRQGDREGAARHFREALRIRPDHDGAARALAEIGKDSGGDGAGPR